MERSLVSGEAEADKGARLVLSANGVAMIATDGARRVFAFGAPRELVDTAAAQALGQRTNPSENSECGAGAMQFSKIGELTLNYQCGALVGWFADNGPGFATIDGIKPGISIADLKRERPVRRLDTTLDGEFEYGSADGQTIGGFADGADDAAAVSSLYAGTNCFFR